MIKKAGPIPAFAQKAASPALQTPQANSSAGTATLTAEERHQRIAEVAYCLAEKRGFQGGSPEQDWFEAAAYVDNQEIAKPLNR